MSTIILFIGIFIGLKLFCNPNFKMSRFLTDNTPLELKQNLMFILKISKIKKYIHNINKVYKKL